MQNRKGFTLIELLIVVVIIGILAAIAIPKFSATREKAYFSAMKSDLRNVQTAQEIYYSSSASNYTYAAGTATNPAVIAPLDFSPSSGVTITVALTADGWTATTSHAALEAAQICAVYVGSTAIAPASTPGVVTCAGEN
jgi:type IV pilus assembly protein PilA